MSSILAVDPGVTTGLAWCDSTVIGMAHDDRISEMVSLGQIDGDIAAQAWKIGRGMMEIRAMVVVSESSDHFLLKGGGELNKYSLVPIKLSGAIDGVVSIINHNYEQRKKVMGAVDGGKWMTTVHEEQTASQAKGVLTDARMKDLGFEWKRAERHQIDAARHLLLFLRRLKDGASKGAKDRSANAALYKRTMERLVD